MFRRHAPRVLLASAVAALALTACGGVGSSSSSDSSGTLNTMGFGTPDEVATSRVQAFTSAYPKIKLKMNKGGFDAQQFLSAVSSGNAPDLVYMDRELIGTYAKKGAIVSMDQCVKDQDIKTSDYRQAAMKEVTLDGHVYGIPEFYDTRVLLADDAVLKQAGVPASDVNTSDWTKLSATAKKLYASSNGKVSRIGFDPKLPEFLPLWAAANGTQLVKPNGQPNLDDPKLVEALTYAVSLINEQGGWSAFKSFRDTWDIFGKDNQIAKNQVGFFPWEGWYLNVLAQNGQAAQFSGTPFLGRDGRPVSFETGSAWAIPKGAKNVKAACEFAKTMTETSTWMKAAAARVKKVAATNQPFTGLYTGNKTADAQIRAKYLKPTGQAGLDSAINAYYTAMDYAVSTPASPAGSEIKDAWTAAVNSVLSGQATPAAAMAKAQKDAMTAYQGAGS
jgi:multiple sugar transport system substrate-binding protein